MPSWGQLWRRFRASDRYGSILRLPSALPGRPSPADESPERPDRRLLLAGGLLIVYPQSEWLIDLGDVIGFPFWISYIAWICVDVLIVAALFVSVRMFSAAKRFVALALAVDVLLALLFWAFYVEEAIGRPALIATDAALALASLAVISWAMWVRLGGSRELFSQTVPLLAAIFFSFAAGIVGIAIQCGTDSCTDRTSAEQIPEVGLPFFEIAAQVIAALLIALAVEARASSAPDIERKPGEGALLAVSVLTFALGAGAALTALATQRDDLPIAFQVSVQALALGFSAILTLTLSTRAAASSTAPVRS